MLTAAAHGLWHGGGDAEALAGVLPRPDGDAIVLRDVDVEGDDAVRDLVASRVPLFEFAIRTTIGRFDLERARVHIRGTKTAQSDRHLPIPAALVELLRAQPEPHAGPVLVRWDCSSSRESLLRAAERAGIPRLTLHDLRRTYASWAVQADLGSSKVAALLGHTSTQMVDKVYAHLAPGHLAEAVERMECVQIRHNAQPEEPETGPDWAREP